MKKYKVMYRLPGRKYQLQTLVRAGSEKEAREIASKKKHIAPERVEKIYELTI